MTKKNKDNSRAAWTDRPSGATGLSVGGL